MFRNQAISAEREATPVVPLGCLLESIEAVEESADPWQGLGGVASCLRAAVPYDSFAVYSLEGGELVSRFASGKVAARGGQAASGSLVARATASREPQLLDGRSAARGSHAAIPMVARGRVMGALELRSRQPGFFSQDRLALLQLLAFHLACALEGARLREDLHQKAETLALLHDLGHELVSILDSQQLFGRIGEMVKRLIDMQLFNVLLWDEEREELEAVFSLCFDGCVLERHAFRLGEGVCGAAADLRRPVRIEDVRKDARYIPCSDHHEVRSELAVPLLNKERLVGVINLESHRVGAFTAEHEKLLSTLGAHIAVACENARLYERLQDDERRLARELEAARLIQRRLLPRRSPWAKDTQIGVAYCPARHLGGDVYDFLALSDGRVGIAVGDVAGKGTGAALYGSLGLGLVRGFVNENLANPSCVLSYLNDELRGLQVEKRFLALTFAVYDAARRTLLLASAGMPYPLLLRGGEVRELEIGGVPVGALPDAQYSQIEVALQPGDVVVFASDGLEEGRNAAGEQFGGEAFRAALPPLAETSAYDLASGLLEASDGHLAGSPPSDDRTVVVLKLVAGD